MTRYVALLRGVNVGGNNKVPMPVLLETIERLGATEVQTLLNSGNVVFTASTALSAQSLERAITDSTGVTTRVVVMDAARFRRIVEAMPFDGDLSRLTIVFLDTAPEAVDLPAQETLDPERFVLGTEACYQSLPDGLSATKLKPAFWKQFPAETTVRNLRTAQKLLDLL